LAQAHACRPAPAGGARASAGPAMATCSATPLWSSSTASAFNHIAGGLRLVKGRWRGRPSDMAPLDALMDALLLLRTAARAGGPASGELVPLLVPAAAAGRVRDQAHSLLLHMSQCQMLQQDIHHSSKASLLLKHVVSAPEAKRWREVHQAGNRAKHDLLYSASEFNSPGAPCAAPAASTLPSAPTPSTEAPATPGTDTTSSPSTPAQSAGADGSRYRSSSSERDMEVVPEEPAPAPEVAPPPPPAHAPRLHPVAYCQCGRIRELFTCTANDEYECDVCVAKGEPEEFSDLHAGTAFLMCTACDFAVCSCCSLDALGWPVPPVRFGESYNACAHRLLAGIFEGESPSRG